MKWFLGIVGIVIALVAVGASYVLIQLTILQPPVVEANVIERRQARVYRETETIKPISSYPKIEAGQAAIYRAGLKGRVLVLLPDSGTGAWEFEPFLTALSRNDRVYAVSLRGMLGAKPATSATLSDYEQDATDALKAARTDALEQNGTGSAPKVVLVGQGMGTLLALKLAQDHPDALEGLVLIAPYVQREWSDQQAWLARTLGGAFYNNYWGDAQSARNFWRDYFPTGFLQRDLANRYQQTYADQRAPYEYRDVLNEVTLGPLRWLPGAYSSLERAKIPVLHVAARYDVVNPLVAQQRLRENLSQMLDERYFFASLNSGRFVSMDWKWRNAASLLEDFVKDLKLDQPLIERETPLDPATDEDPLNKR